MKAWRRFLTLIALIGVVALLGSACGDGDSAGDADVSDDGHTHVAGEPDNHGDAVETYVANAGDFVSAADWDSMQTVRVNMSDFAFAPASLTLATGQPYKLEVVNDGATKHYFTAGEFYRSVAFRKAQTSEGEFKAPYFKAIEVFPGDQIDLYFVPVVPGAYGSLCTIAGHEEQGMHGTITVTGVMPESFPTPLMAVVSEGDWVQTATTLVSEANWDAMESLAVEMTDFAFTPEKLTFQVGKPYKLSVINAGSEKHYFTAEGFYLSAAFRKAQDDSGEIKAPYFKAVEIFPGEQIDLYLIPTKVGVYDSLCTITGHEDAGMFGTIVVEPAT